MTDGWDAFLANYYSDLERKMPRLPNMPAYNITSIAQKSYNETRESLGVGNITVETLKSKLYNAKGALNLEFLAENSPSFKEFKTNYDSLAQKLTSEHRRLSRLRDGLNEVPNHNTPVGSLMKENTINIADTQKESVVPTDPAPANQDYAQPRPSVALEMKLETLHEIKKSIEDGFDSIRNWFIFYGLAGMAVIGIAYTQLDNPIISRTQTPSTPSASMHATDYTPRFTALESQLNELSKKQTSPSIIVTGTQELADRMSTLEINVANALRSLPREIHSTQVQEMNRKIASISQAIQSIPPSIPQTEVQEIYQRLDNLGEVLRSRPAQTAATVTKVVQDPARLKEIQELREQNLSIKRQYEELRPIKPQPKERPSPKPSAKPKSRLENALDDAEY